MNLTIKSYLDGINNKKFSVKEVVYHYLNKAKKSNEKYNAIVRFHEDYVEKNIDVFVDRELKSAPIGIKDIILTKDYITSFGSKMGKDFVSSYSATCFQNLENNGGLMIGKTNMDEFAMGSSTETSYFGNTKNIYGKNRVPGGSSGGSAVAVAGDLCLGALGTDTGGSIRQPACLTGIVGLKPTYGRVSRYGVQAMASSFDQVGVFTKTVEDSMILLRSICGFDTHDANMIKNEDFENWSVDLGKDGHKDFRIAIPKQYLGDGLDDKIKVEFENIIKNLEKEGIQIDIVDLPILDIGLSIYYTLMPAEVSTNLARFDGIRFGNQEKMNNFEDQLGYYKKIRSEGFGEEVKRRILLGGFVLSSSHYEGYYKKAMQARNQVKYQMKKLFEKYDFILSPTSPEVSWKIGEKIDDPLKMYLADLYTVIANLVGIPGISLPAGFVEDKGERMPWGIQLLSDKREEEKIFKFGNWFEKNFSI